MKPNPAAHVIISLGKAEARKQLIVLCGLHGNEPAGKNAILRCIQVLVGREIALDGQVVFLEGNLGASEAYERFVKRDLNRLWTAENLERLEASRDQLEDEDREQYELVMVFQELIQSGKESFFLDLHTTSSKSPPFVPFCLDGRDLPTGPVLEALALPRLDSTPILGTSGGYFAENGVSALVVEGGEHEADESAENLESAICITLHSLGILETQIPEVVLAKERLAAATEKLPRMVRPTYRHAISAADGFVMRPGFKNFQKVLHGEVLADDRNGMVICPSDGILLFPLYQPQGEEGFLVAKAISS